MTGARSPVTAHDQFRGSGGAPRSPHQLRWHRDPRNHHKQIQLAVQLAQDAVDILGQQFVVSPQTVKRDEIIHRIVATLAADISHEGKARVENALTIYTASLKPGADAPIPSMSSH